MNNKTNKSKLTKTLLKSFAKGELDEQLQAKVIKTLLKNPKLMTQVEAIAVDSIVAKLAMAKRKTRSAKSKSLPPPIPQPPKANQPIADFRDAAITDPASAVKNFIEKIKSGNAASENFSPLTERNNSLQQVLLGCLFLFMAPPLMIGGCTMLLIGTSNPSSSGGSRSSYSSSSSRGSDDWYEDSSVKYSDKVMEYSRGKTWDDF